MKITICGTQIESDDILEFGPNGFKSVYVKLKDDGFHKFEFETIYEAGDAYRQISSAFECDEVSFDDDLDIIANNLGCEQKLQGA